MGSSAKSAQLIAPAFLRRFRAEADPGGRMRFDRFMDLALYDEHCGYYRRSHQRVGRDASTDFYTASSMGSLFGELLEAAARTLLGPGRMLQNHVFVEIGPEPNGGVMTGRQHGFKALRLLPLGEEIVIEGPCVVFANELFDAQPCRRFVRRRGTWWELGVELNGEELREIEWGPAATIACLPADAPENYQIDAPEAATALLQRILRQPWHGLFVTCDYGKSWSELSGATPAGTLRAYHRHRQTNGLLNRPGEQDLTCHVCWDWLESTLRNHGFPAPALESQESFLVRHASDLIARTINDMTGFSPRKQTLLQLIHPAHMGRKFQVLHGLRPASGR